jgi:Ca2+-binding RTX toxin-like protein
MDRLEGQDGRDGLLGGGGNDEVRGGTGADWIRTGSGKDNVRGGMMTGTYCRTRVGPTASRGTVAMIT